MGSSSPKIFLVCHGAWSAGWAWKKMHRLVTPSYTGLGERAHLAHPGIDLDAHVEDMLNVIKYEDLRDVVLIGHSYGGMVATGVADRARDKIKQLIYIDAFVPNDGQSLLDLYEADRPRMQELLKSGDGWRVPRIRRHQILRLPTSNGCPRAASICRSNASRQSSACKVDR
jgi:pimeloyl-ACP methyl ester carboxylesterase